MAGDNGFVPPTLSRLARLLEKLAKDLSLMPTFRYAVVTSVSPLRIKYDLDGEALAGTPETLVNGLAVGDRVWVQRQFRRDIVLGRGGGPVEPVRSGLLNSVGTGTLAQVGTTQIYASPITVTVPVVPPDGYVVKVSALTTGNGWGSLSQVSTTPGLSSTVVMLRFTQVGSESAQSLTLLWELVKVG